ncbi:hypothetical protein ACKQTC_07075 [Peptococcus simiae]|uniref:Uncharacterized protein n=1 Tax=Peptococcus simiae TaxID=1643805 RepID=A0ABW9GZU9_9FIRM
MDITEKEVETYLEEAKALIRDGDYRIARNANRSDNNDLFLEYVLSEAEAEKILLSLSTKDFSEARRNQKEGYGHELLYIFGKKVELLERFGANLVIVPLYIKLNRIENKILIVVSFHKQKYKLIYCFKD